MVAKDTKTILMLAGAAAVVLLIVWKMGLSQEGYTNQPLSSLSYMKRTPVTYALRGDGMSENPHYRAFTGDKTVPLESSNLNFYSDDLMPNNIAAPRSVVDAAMGSVGGGLVNDAKLRMDLYESGDISFANYLFNLPVSNHLDQSGRFLEASYAKPDPASPLYDPSFHYGDLLGN